MKLSWVACVVLLIGIVFAADIEISADRMIDLSNQYVTEFVTYEVTNTAKQAKLTSVEIALSTNGLSYWIVDASEGKSPKDIRPQYASKQRTETHGDIEYLILTVELAKTLEPGETTKFQAVGVYTHLLSPLPKEIEQRQPQSVLYNGNHYIASPYTLTRQRTEIRTLQEILDHSTLDPTAEENSIVTFGDYHDVEAFSFSPSRVHFISMAPFVTITKEIKEIEVSHWGNVAIEEIVSVQNDGAKLTGSFSRLDYMQGAMGNSIPRIVTYLPAGSSDVYYRDIIGNISSSHVFPHERGGLKFEIIPRFLLMGGWKTEFYYGYNLPSGSYLNVDGDQYVLSVPFTNEVEHTVIDELEFRVILPEGAHAIQISAPFEIFDKEDTLRFSHLDIYGRPEIRFKAKNVISAHKDQNLVVTYKFNSSSMFLEPLYLIGITLAFFFIVIVYFRLDLSIQDTASEATSKAAHDNEILRNVLEILKRREQTLTNFANSNFKSRGDLTSASNQLQSVLKSASDQLKIQADKLGDHGEIVRGLQSLDKEFDKRVEVVKKIENAKVNNPKDPQINKLQDQISSLADYYREEVDHLSNLKF